MTAHSGESEPQQVALGLRSRDSAFIHVLVERFQYRLVRYLVYLLGRRDGVDDLVQETWLRVLERGASYDGRSRFEPWLFSVARNLAIDGMRKQRVGSLDDEEEWSACHPQSNEPSPFLLAARSQDASQLAETMQKLGSVHREALVLRFQEELSLQEIAALTGAPVSTVASRIHRGLEAMRKQLEEHNHAR